MAHSWHLRIIYAAFVLISLDAVIDAVSAQSDHSLGIRIATGIIVEIVILSVMAGLGMLFSILPLISKRNRTFHTDHTLTLDESGLTEATPYNTSVYKWKAIQKIVQTKKYLFLYVAQQMAHVIPRRAVSSEEEWSHLHDSILGFTQDTERNNQNIDPTESGS